MLEAEPAERPATTGADERDDSAEIARVLSNGARVRTAAEVLDCTERCRPKITDQSIMVVHRMRDRHGVPVVLIEIFARDRAGDDDLSSYSRILLEVRQGAGGWIVVRKLEHATT